MRRGDERAGGTSKLFCRLFNLMGNYLSRKKNCDITTYEGWDTRMQEIVSVLPLFAFDRLEDRGRDEAAKQQ